jgi:rhamnogalacturonan acetylesterase
MVLCNHLPFVAGLVLQLLSLAAAGPTPTNAPPALYLCSDSTAANYNPQTTPIQGFASNCPSTPKSANIHSFGYYLGEYLNLNFTNLARGGRSTRSFQNQGLWAQLLSYLKPGDFVVIEMGHNDNGTPGTGSDVTKDRAVLPGIGEESIVVANTTGGTGNETVYTFGHYLRGMIKDVRARKAIPVLSGMVPTMSWENGTLRTEWPFTEWAWETAESQQTGWVDHTRYSVERFQALGETAARAMFPQDSTHTDADGAICE